MQTVLQTSGLEPMPDKFTINGNQVNLSDLLPPWVPSISPDEMKGRIREYYLNRAVPSQGHDEFLVRLFVRKNHLLTGKARAGLRTIKILDTGAKDTGSLSGGRKGNATQPFKLYRFDPKIDENGKRLPLYDHKKGHVGPDKRSLDQILNVKGEYSVVPFTVDLRVYCDVITRRVGNDDRLLRVATITAVVEPLPKQTDWEKSSQEKSDNTFYRDFLTSADQLYINLGEIGDEIIGIEKFAEECRKSSQRYLVSVNDAEIHRDLISLYDFLVAAAWWKIVSPLRSSIRGKIENWEEYEPCRIH